MLAADKYHLGSRSQQACSSATFITSRDIDNLDDILNARLKLQSQRDYIMSNKA